MKSKDFKDFVDKYASAYASYLKVAPPAVHQSRGTTH
jgi:hypothetical protein